MPDQATIERVLTRATRAPSSHNTQPWLFRVGKDHIDLLADRTRALPANDPNDRELTISCGCALMTLRVAIAAEHVGCETLLLPDETEEELLARLQFTGPPDIALAGLAPAINQRQTHRVAFDKRSVAPHDLDVLVEAAGAEGAWFIALTDDTVREEVASLVAEGDAVQWHDPRWRRELAQWMHPRRKGDGLTLPWLAIPAAQMVVRRFDMGGGVAAHDAILAEGSPLLAVLGTESDSVVDWLTAGQALQRLLLTGVGLGLQASYLNQPVQVAELRPKLQVKTGQEGFAQILLRMGYSDDRLVPSPRRSLSDMLLVGGD